MPAHKGKLTRQGVTIRTFLLVLVLAAVIPLGVFAAALLYVISSQQHAEMERGLLETANALAASVDSHVDSSFKRMTVLANETSIQDGDLERFAARCLAALVISPDWRGLLLTSPDGDQVVNTIAPPNSTLPSGLGLPYVKEAFDTGQPVISQLFIGRISKEPVVGLAVPVKLKGSVAYVLASGLSLEYFSKLITRGVGTGGGAAALLDQDFKYIARSGDKDQRVGAPATASLRAGLAARSAGIARFTTEDGLSIVGAWSRVPKAGWTIFVATPLAAYRATLMGYFAVLTAIWLAVAVGGALAATYLARRIAKDIRSLAAEAEELANGRPVTGTESSIVELGALGRAHKDAGMRLNDLIERERHYRETAQAENNAKDEFLAMLGHELRNPAGAISNAARILQLRHDDTQSVRFAADVISRQSQQLRRLIDDLLDVNRIISGSIQLEKKRINLVEGIEAVVAALDAGAKVSRYPSASHTAPVWVDADPTRMEQIVSNLVSNAVTHTPDDGQVMVDVAQESGDAVLRVSDTGVGIAPEHLPHIFKLFYQAPQALDRAKGGLGIGLTLVQRLAALHGGSVSVSSDGPGKGATFTVRLPAASPPGREAPASAIGDTSSTAIKVLLVEDDADSRESLKRALELDGHTVQAAPDARSALTKLAEWMPDIAIVDIGLPVMSGYQFAEAVRKKLGRTPVLVALTGYGRPEDEKQARQAGFDEHLTKPADFGRLLAIVRASRTQPRR